MTSPFDEQDFLRRLISAGHITGPAAQKATGGAGSLFRRLLSHGLIEEAPLAEIASELLDIPLTGTPLAVDPACDGLLTPAFMAQHKVIPLAAGDGWLKLAIADPSDAYAVDAVALGTGKRVDVVLATASAIDAALGADPDHLPRPDEGFQPGPAVPTAPDEAHEGPAAQLLEDLIGQGVAARASDIHLEPFDGRVRLRLRVDGRLESRESPAITFSEFNALIGRIKVLSRLDMTERRKPQDGRFVGVTRGRRVDVRVSILPTLFGESVALRLLDKTTAPLDLGQLGFSGEAFRDLGRVFDRNRGLILVTGPTGSGKTTTLYAALAGFNTGARKIVTVEDPVEYDLPGVNQIQVQPEVGLGFASALRSILRHDPDIIMVGEIRDPETARLAVQAALTGHLVIATVHADSASGAIPRMLDMGVEPFLLSSTLAGVVSQRLVRQLCASCRREAGRAGAAVQGMSQVHPGSMQFFAADGCADCGQTGRRGRLPIAEIMAVSPELGELIRGQASTGAIEAAVRAAGGRSLLDDGLALASAGQTGLEDVLAVTDAGAASE